MDQTRVPPRFTHAFRPNLLREYDLRGIVGENLHPADAFALGRGFAAIVAEHGEPTVAVGRDGRLSSPDLEAALVEGLLAGGARVLHVGLGPTPMLYFAALTSRATGAVMVTGSHNPADYNGFKMMLAGKPFYGEAIRSLGARVAAGVEAPVRPGAVEPLDVAAAYADRLAADWDGGARGLQVVWDNGNGAAGEALVRLVRRLPGRHTVLNAAIDGRFPAHHPDPTLPANLAQLIAAVRGQGADLGIAFDGDADRIGVVDDEGTILWGDQLMLLLGRDILATRPGATIIADVKASQVLFDEIAAAGGRPLMWKTGHSLIKAKMAETGAPLAGEMSGHLFFADRWYGFDDALYAAVRLLGLLARSGRRLSELRAGFPQVLNTPELRFDCSEERKFAVIAEVAARLAARGAAVNAVDGVRVREADGWWLLRASNTQAVLVARAEAATAAGLARLKARIAEELLACGLPVPDFDSPAAGH